MVPEYFCKKVKRKVGMYNNRKISLLTIKNEKKQR